uniref:Uncharacterized protein n=1 Tax=Lepeophtheirus salmonis TaxID=72036 RepID=A0A0K2T9B8_LEPSM
MDSNILLRNLFKKGFPNDLRGMRILNGI